MAFGRELFLEVYLYLIFPFTGNTYIKRNNCGRRKKFWKRRLNYCKNIFNWRNL